MDMRIIGQFLLLSVFWGGSVNWFFLELVSTSVTSMQALEGNSGLTLTSGRPNSSDALLTT